MLADCTAVGSVSSDSKRVSVANLNPRGPHEIGCVNCVAYVVEVKFKVIDCHEKAAIIFAGETNLDSDRRIGCPEWVSITIRSSPFSITPRVSNLNNLDPVRQGVSTKDRISMASNET